LENYHIEARDDAEVAAAAFKRWPQVSILVGIGVNDSTVARTAS
jgi:hypothetical protein